MFWVWSITSEAVVVTGQAFTVITTWTRLVETTGTGLDASGYFRVQAAFVTSAVAACATAASWSIASPASRITVETNPFQFELVKKVTDPENSAHHQEEDET